MFSVNRRTNDRLVLTVIVEHRIIDGFLVDMARSFGECLARRRESMTERSDALDSLGRLSRRVDSVRWHQHRKCPNRIRTPYYEDDAPVNSADRSSDVEYLFSLM